MRWLASIVVIAACGGKQTPQPSNDEPAGVVTDTRSEFEKRLDRACDALGPRLTQCAVDDAKAQLDSGTISQQEYAEITKPEVKAALRKDWDDRCYRPDKMSSRQLRVLEVCFAEETECAPLLDCLANLTASPSK